MQRRIDVPLVFPSCYLLKSRNLFIFIFLRPITVSFIPVDLRHPEDFIGKTYLCDSFGFFPAAWTELTEQSHNVSNSAANCYRFNLCDFTDNLEVQTPILRMIEEGINLSAQLTGGEASSTSRMERMRGEVRAIAPWGPGQPE